MSENIPLVILERAFTKSQRLLRWLLWIVMYINHFETTLLRLFGSGVEQ